MEHAITYRCKSNPNVQVTLEFSGTAEKAAIEKAFISAFLEKALSEFMLDKPLQSEQIQSQKKREKNL